jgi:hypothetical protein
MNAGKYVGFEVLTAVIMRNSIFWDITPCSPLKVRPRFRKNGVGSTLRAKE